MEPPLNNELLLSALSLAMENRSVKQDGFLGKT